MVSCGTICQGATLRALRVVSKRGEAFFVQLGRSARCDDESTQQPETRLVEGRAATAAFGWKMIFGGVVARLEGVYLCAMELNKEA